ncbi:SCO2522 family protein [Nocardia yamanashiensis]|uniref:SCO2522 family protein n=1 Tax=Nocardia yamanashiensis TaxID=209247 RepID=UPI001E3D2522|nr:SCO2522 family protein [Nocardia yamanashiensis]UGT40575.1 SCO2522 family protein [Nocardia yamanashiensis]
MDFTADYSELETRDRIAGQALSHLSVEVGHFYMDELAGHADRVEAQLRQVAPLVAAFTGAAGTEFGAKARVSTCFLVDDYFSQGRSIAGEQDTDPRVVLGRLLELAERTGVRIDYLVREAACAVTPVFAAGEPTGTSILLADMMAARIVDEPAPNTNGRRPPTADTGWLCNGRRSPESGSFNAMRKDSWQPPEEFNARNHSIFLDVQLWSDDHQQSGSRRVWSCPFLACIWQLLRLGMIRYEGAVIAEPVQWNGTWPGEWAELPAVVQLNPRARPFAAYRALSILPNHYLGIEHAVRVILEHLQLDDQVYNQLTDRGLHERPEVRVPREVTRRLRYAFIGDS